MYEDMNLEEGDVARWHGRSWRRERNENYIYKKPNMFMYEILKNWFMEKHINKMSFVFKTTTKWSSVEEQHLHLTSGYHMQVCLHGYSPARMLLYKYACKV